MGTILLALSIVSGQLVRLPIVGGGLNLLDITIIILCTWGLLKSRFKLKKAPLWISASFVFILVGLLSLVATPVILTRIEFFGSFAYLIRFSLYILLGWLIYSNALPNLKKNIHPILFISASALAAIGLTQLIFLPDLRFLTKFGWDPHYFRTTSTFLDPNFLGSFLVLSLLLIFRHSRESGNLYKWIPHQVRNDYLIFGIIYLALLTTFSRGSYLAFLTSFSLLSFLNKSLKQFILALILFGGLLLGFQTYQILIAQPRGVNRNESAQFRETTWQQGWQLFLKSPISGVGFNTYKFALKQYNLADENFLQTHGSTTNDSSLLYVLATTGILGFISYLYFLFILFKSNLKARILPAALVGVITQSFFANTLFYPPILVWIILVAAQKK